MQMVNAGFPEHAAYGFEMVDAPWGFLIAENSRQSKIYTESNQSHFSRIFDDLTSKQTPAIYPALLVTERLRD
jgi:hypothetical protein